MHKIGSLPSSKWISAVVVCNLARRAVFPFMAFDTRPSEPCALIAYESFDRADTSPSLSAIRQRSASEAALTFRIMLLR